jgi:hypothetical protein
LQEFAVSLGGLDAWDAQSFQAVGYDEPDGANNGVPARFCGFFI